MRRNIGSGRSVVSSSRSAASRSGAVRAISACDAVERPGRSAPEGGAGGFRYSGAAAHASSADAKTSSGRRAGLQPQAATEVSSICGRRRSRGCVYPRRPPSGRSPSLDQFFDQATAAGCPPPRTQDPPARAGSRALPAPDRPVTSTTRRSGGGAHVRRLHKCATACSPEGSRHEQTPA